MTVSESTLKWGGGDVEERHLRMFDAQPRGTMRGAVVLHLGSPHTGAPFGPFLAEAMARGIRLLSCARPGYGSMPDGDRAIADGATTTAAVLDAARVDRAAVLGYSGGGPHALAAAALLGDRIVAVACFASPTPYSGDESWFRGMAGGGAAVRAALDGRQARTLFEESEEFEPSSFNDDDYTALAGTWQALGEDVRRSFRGTGHGGLVDDDLALVRPWGAALRDIRAPVRLWHGSDDRVIPVDHSQALLSKVPSATREVVAGAGHVSVLNRIPDAYDWILAR